MLLSRSGIETDFMSSNWQWEMRGVIWISKLVFRVRSKFFKTYLFVNCYRNYSGFVAERFYFRLWCFNLIQFNFLSSFAGNLYVLFGTSWNCNDTKLWCRTVRWKDLKITHLAHLSQSSQEHQLAYYSPYLLKFKTRSGICKMEWIWQRDDSNMKMTRTFTISIHNLRPKINSGFFQTKVSSWISCGLFLIGQIVNKTLFLLRK